MGDKELSVTLKVSETNSKVFVPDMSVTFSLDEKSDQPIVKMPTLDELKEMLNKKTTLGELRRQGYG
ncbi:MAG: hypothetical protein J5518_03765 [Lachnospiraceae bacterium]|nr:hypothetical protein [Lachnospiraceae bacterium]